MTQRGQLAKRHLRSRAGVRYPSKPVEPRQNKPSCGGVPARWIIRRGRIMGAIREQAEKFWSGELSVVTQHPLIPTGDFEEVAAGVMFYRWLANFTAVKSEEGLVLVDTGIYFNQAQTVELVRKFAPDRINTAIYTHGHVDHACGTPAFVEEAQQRHVARPLFVDDPATT